MSIFIFNSEIVATILPSTDNMSQDTRVTGLLLPVVQGTQAGPKTKPQTTSIQQAGEDVRKDLLENCTYSLK